MDQLNDATWQQYRRWRVNQDKAGAAWKGKGKKVDDTTAVKELNIMRAALNWGRRNRWPGLTDVKVYLPNSESNPQQGYLSRDEARRLIEGCVEPHTELFVRLALATGARTGALLEVTWDRVHWPVGRSAPVDDGKAFYAVNVRPHAGPDGVDFDLELKEALRLDLGRGRGNKKRGTGVIGLDNVELYRALKEAYERRQSEHVIEWRGKPIGKIYLDAAYRRAGLTHFRRRKHILKHTCCTWLVQSGASFEAVAKLVGTTAVMIERVYRHLSPAHLATVSKALSVETNGLARLPKRRV